MTCTDMGYRKIVQEIESREKCLCILVNNAGIAAEKTETKGESAEQLKEFWFEPTRYALDGSFVSLELTCVALMNGPISTRPTS